MPWPPRKAANSSADNYLSNQATGTAALVVSARGGEMISGAQCRMARAGLNMTIRDLAKEIGCSGAALSLVENEQKECSELKEKLVIYFTSQRVYFGPRDGVCLRTDIFASERNMVCGLFDLLKEAGIHPNSTQLLVAMAKVKQASE